MHKIKILCLIIFLISISANYSEADSAIFKEIAVEINSIKDVISNKTIAVLPFDSPDSNGKNTGEFIAGKITHELVSSGELKIVERTKIDRVINEQELSISGAASADAATKIGKLLSVDAIVVGALSNQKNKIDILVRIIDVKTGKILKSISKKYEKNSGLNSGFQDNWKVITTAKYFKDYGIKYKKLILTDDDTYELHLINNANRIVVFKGVYEIEGNNIDYRPQKMFINGRPTYLPGGSAVQKGTVYIVDCKLYFTVIDMRKNNKRRLNAMKKRFRNTAERKK